MSLPAAKKMPAPATPAPPPVRFAGTLLAWAMPERNPHLLVAYVPGTDPQDPRNLVSVTVRSNRNFLRGMTIKTVRLVSEGRYELTGPGPRWRGRW